MIDAEALSRARSVGLRCASLSSSFSARSSNEKRRGTEGWTPTRAVAVPEADDGPFAFRSADEHSTQDGCAFSLGHARDRARRAGAPSRNLDGIRAANPSSQPSVSRIKFSLLSENCSARLVGIESARVGRRVNFSPTGNPATQTGARVGGGANGPEEGFLGRDREFFPRKNSERRSFEDAARVKSLKVSLGRALDSIAGRGRGGRVLFLPRCRLVPGGPFADCATFLFPVRFTSGA